MYGSDVKHVHIVHRSGTNNTNADALSCNPLHHLPDQSETVGEGEIQVATAQSDNTNISTILTDNGDYIKSEQHEQQSFAEQQREDTDILPIIIFTEEGKLPDDSQQAEKIAAQATQFTVVDQVLYFIDPRRCFKFGENSAVE